MENSILVHFLPKIEKLNAIYANIISNKRLNYEEQRFITLYYEQYSNIVLFDMTLVQINVSGRKERYISVIKNVHDEISSNIQLYSSNEKYLNAIDVHKICEEKISISQKQIKAQLNV